MAQTYTDLDDSDRNGQKMVTLLQPHITENAILNLAHFLRYACDCWGTENAVREFSVGN